LAINAKLCAAIHMMRARNGSFAFNRDRNTKPITNNERKKLVNE